MIIGYARTSTADQVAGYEAQIKELELAGCTLIYKEQISSKATREQLNAMLDYARDEDIVVVTKIDRLARSMADLVTIIKRLDDKHIGLRILNLGMDTQTPTGKLILSVLGAVAQFEREIMLERQREGICKAQIEGKYKGRKPYADEIRDEVRHLFTLGVPKTRIAKQLKLGEATVHRIIAEVKSGV